MIIYKRGILSLIIGIFSIHFGIIIAILLLNYFFSNLVTMIIAAVLYLVLWYIILCSDNIKFIVDEENKTLSYYQKGKLQKIYELNGASLSYNMTTRKNQGATKIHLYINGDTIDCEPLGQFKFYRMLEQLEKLSETAPIKVKVDGKEE